MSAETNYRSPSMVTLRSSRPAKEKVLVLGDVQKVEVPSRRLRGLAQRPMDGAFANPELGRDGSHAETLR